MDEETGPRMNVLYIDDEPDLREIAVLALQLDPEIRAAACDGGIAGLAAIERQRPDVVLLDVMMPGLDGPATLARIRQDHGPDLPIVFITARAQPGDIAALMALGAKGVIEKPFDPMALGATLRKVMAE